MGIFTLKVIQIKESKSIGRELKADVTANSVKSSFPFKGNTTRHHPILKDGAIEDKPVTIPIKISVTETDPKFNDGPYAASGSIIVDPSKMDKQDYAPLSLSISEVGKKGKIPGKTATLEFYFEALVTCKGGKNNRTTSAEGIDFIKGFEKVSYSEYRDPVGNPTIGAGHKIRLPEEKYLMTATLTDDQVNALLAKDLAIAEKTVSSGIKICLKQNQFDALVSLAFNHGSLGDVRKSINANASEATIRAAFNEYIKGRDKKTGQLIVLSGLVKRRKQEGDLYFSE